METTGWCIRIDAREGYADKISMLPHVHQDFESLICVKHNGKSGENPHYHMVIKTITKDKCMRARMKKIFDQGKGNGHMSIKPWDGDIRAISYLYHEDDSVQPVLIHNITPEYLERCKAVNREVQEKVEQAKNRASWKLEEIVYEQIKDSRPEYIEVEKIAEQLVLTALRMDKYLPNDFQLKSMANKIYFKLLNGDVQKEDEFVKMYVAKVFRTGY